MLLTTIFGSGSAHSASINLIQNGEFEDPSGTGVHVYGSIPAWTSNQVIELWSQGIIGSPSFGSDGVATGQHLEITRFGTSQYISQSFIVPDGVAIGDFSFDAWPRRASGVFYDIVGSVSGDILNGYLSLSGLGGVWTNYTGTGLSIVEGEEISVSFRSNGGGSEGAHIDGVTFNVVPLPPAMLLFGSALVYLAGVSMLRKKRNCA
jgi:hypothetical protein